MRTASSIALLHAAAFGALISVGYADNGESLDINQPNYESIASISVKRPDGIWPQPFVSVTSDGARYTGAVGDLASYALAATVKTSRSKWRVKHLRWGIGAHAAQSGLLSGVNHGYGSFHTVAGVAANVEHFSQQLAVNVPLAQSGLGEFAVARCNAMRKALEQQGLAALTIFNADRNITIPVAFHFAARAAFKGETFIEAPGPEVNPYWRQAVAWFDMPVRCLKAPALDLKTKTDPTPVPTAQDFKLKVGVNQAALAIVPNDYHGACPAKLNASATIVTNGPVTVKYRFESDKGELSPVFSVKVDHTLTAFASTVFSVGAQGGPGFIAQPAPGAGNQAFAAAPRAPGVLQGFYRLHVIEPNAVSSAPASYKVTCQTPITAGAGKLAPTPGADTPAAMLRSPMPSASQRAMPTSIVPPVRALPSKR